MSLPYARNAQQIADARANGMKPAGVVLVALCQIPDWPDAKVYARPDVAYRWDWVRGLSIVVLINAKTRMKDILREIHRNEPSQLDVVDVERSRGWLVDFFGGRMETVRWTAFQVKDWLGDGSWHRQLETVKEQCRLACISKRKEDGMAWK
jgi:hypothetical protein